MNRWLLGALFCAPLLSAPARAEDRPPEGRAEQGGQRPTVRTFTRVEVVDDPRKAPPLPTSRTQRPDEGRNPGERSAGDRLLRPGERPDPRRSEPQRPEPPRSEERPDRPRPGRSDGPADRPHEVLRDGPRRDAAELRQLRQELREERREQRAAGEGERLRPQLRERVRERLRDAARPQRDVN